MCARWWENLARLPWFSIPRAQGHGRGGYLELADARGDACEGPPDFKLPEQDYSPWRLLFNHLLELVEVSF